MEDRPRQEIYDFIDYLDIAWRRKILILTGIIIATLIAVIYSLTATKMYQAVATVLVLEPRSAEPFADEKFTVDNYATMADSPHFKLEMIALPEFNLIEQGYDIRDMESLINVEVLDGTRIISISVEFEDREQAAAMADWLAQRFIDYNKQLISGEIAATKTFLGGQFETNQAQLDEVTQYLQTYSAKNKVSELEEKVKFLSKSLEQIEVLYTQSGSLGVEREKQVQTLEVELKKIPETVRAHASAESNPAYLEIERGITRNQIKLLGLKQKNSDDHPDVIALKKEISEAQKVLNETDKVIISNEEIISNPVYQSLLETYVNAKADAEALKARSAAIGKRYKEVKTELEESANQLSAVKSERDSLDYKLLALSEYNALLKSRLDSAGVEVGGRMSDAQFSSRAIAPEPKHKIWPKRKLIVMTAFVLSAFFMFFFAVFIEYIEKAKRERGAFQ